MRHPIPTTLLVVGLVLTAFTAAALYIGIRSALRLPARVVVYAVGYSTLVIAMKFVLGPSGLYQVTRRSLCKARSWGA